MTFLVATTDSNSFYSITNTNMIIGRTNDDQVVRGDINMEILSHKNINNKHVSYDVNRRDFLAINPRIFNKEVAAVKRLGLIR